MGQLRQFSAFWGVTGLEPVPIGNGTLGYTIIGPSGGVVQARTNFGIASGVGGKRYSVTMEVEQSWIGGEIVWDDGVNEFSETIYPLGPPVDGTIHVRADGSDIWGDGSALRPYATLSAAYADVTTLDDELVVGEGDFDVNIAGQINKAFSIRGAGMDRTRLHSVDTGTDGAVLDLADYVRVSDLTLDQTTATWAASYTPGNPRVPCVHFWSQHAGATPRPWGFTRVRFKAIGQTAIELNAAMNYNSSNPIAQLTFDECVFDCEGSLAFLSADATVIFRNCTGYCGNGVYLANGTLVLLNHTVRVDVRNAGLAVGELVWANFQGLGGLISNSLIDMPIIVPGLDTIGIRVAHTTDFDRVLVVGSTRFNVRSGGGGATSHDVVLENTSTLASGRRHYVSLGSEVMYDPAKLLMKTVDALDDPIEVTGLDIPAEYLFIADRSKPAAQPQTIKEELETDHGEGSWETGEGGGGGDQQTDIEETDITITEA